MRILHVIATLSQETGGPSKAAIEMAVAVAKLGHEVSIYATDYGGDVIPLEFAQSAGVDIQLFPVQEPRFWRYSSAMGLALEEKIPNVDVVHIHSFYHYHNWIAGKICRKHNVPFVLQPHGSLDPYLYVHHRWRKAIIDFLFQTRLFKETAAVLCTTEDEQELAKPYIHGAPSQVVSLGIYMEEYASLPPGGTFKSKYPETEGRKLILFLGRLNFKKGLDILIPAFAKACKAVDDLHLVIVGPDGGTEKQARDWVVEHNVSDRTTFTGMLYGEDILAAYSDADVFVLSSYSENFGLTVIEALACGVPVLISDKVNIWREVERTGGGLVGPPDIEKFTEMLIKIMSDDSLREQMAGEAVSGAQREFSWENIAGRMEDFYKSII